MNKGVKPYIYIKTKDSGEEKERRHVVMYHQAQRNI